MTIQVFTHPSGTSMHITFLRHENKDPTMTIQVVTFNASKTVLRDALASTPGRVRFFDPSPTDNRMFSGLDIKLGDLFPVVLDHPRRTRFAKIERRPDGTFRVT